MAGVNALIIGTTIRGQGKSCIYKADLLFSGKIKGTLHLPNPGKQGFAIVDFSADGKKLLVSDERESEYPNEQFRNVEAAIVTVDGGQPHFANTWDVFGWHECDAMVEPQGFTPEGQVVLRARPSVMSVPRRPNCVPNVGLYKTDLVSSPVRLPDDTKVQRFGKLIADQVQACKTDPDIIGACFKLRGRLSAWNGSPTLRIWRVGTKRMLGTQDGPLPENLAKQMDWGVEAWGDFEVCPYTKERPGVMQSVCIESAEHLFFRTR
jgi:hypothetical protein